MPFLYIHMRYEKVADPFYKSSRWLSLRERVFRRDGYQCAECRRYGRHTQADMVHHAIPREDFPEIQYEAWNCISLCNACHERMHMRHTDSLSSAGIDAAKRALRKVGKDERYLRELEQRRAT